MVACKLAINPENDHLDRYIPPRDKTRVRVRAAVLHFSEPLCVHLYLPLGMDPLGLLGLSTIPEEFRDSVEDFRDPVDKLRDPHQEPEDYIVGTKGSYDVDDAKPIIEKARRLLNREVRVGVEDGRVFVGKLHCLDKQKNIILYDAVEFRSFPGRGEVGVEAKQAAEQRSLGLVLIPARCRTSCYVKCSLDEKMDFLNINT